MLQSFTLQPAKGSKHRSKRVGRGNASGHGTTAARGGKGQTSRSGGSHGLTRLGFRHIMQQTPKLRGFHSQAGAKAEVSLAMLDKSFEPDSTVSLATLQEKNLIPKRSGQRVKIINTGTLTKKLVVEGVKTTKGAAEKIMAAGGEIK